MYVLDGMDVKICNGEEIAVEAVRVWILFFELAMIYLIWSDKKVFANYKFFSSSVTTGVRREAKYFKMIVPIR